jgi:Protein of unknown function (DUF3320)
VVMERATAAASASLAEPLDDEVGALPEEAEAPETSSPLTAPLAAEVDEPAILHAEPLYARAAGQSLKPMKMPAAEGLYRITDFSAVSAFIDPASFYEADYDDRLVRLAGHVVSSEAPISETLLVQRIARVHNFSRAGRIIRDRVMALVERHHHVEKETGGGRFVWVDAIAPSTWCWARSPASDDDIRQIEEIALAELRIAAQRGGPVEIARHFGIRRLSASARTRIEMVS